MVRSVLRFLVPALLVGCPGMMMPAFVDVTATPRSITADGAMTVIKVRATDETGGVGAGQVRIRSVAGSLRDGEIRSLDSFGTTELEFSCDVSADSECKSNVRITADWNRNGTIVTGEVSVRVGTEATGGGAGGGGTGGGGMAAVGVLMMGTTNGNAEYGLGPIVSGATSEIRLGLTSPSINMTAGTNERIFLTESGDLVYVSGTVFRRFLANGTDMPLSTPGCSVLGDTRLLDSPDGLLYSCPNTNTPRGGVLLNRVSDGQPHPYAALPIWQRSNAIPDAIGRDSVLFWAGEYVIVNASMTEVKPPNAPGRCELVTSTPAGYLCYVQRSLYVITPTGATNRGPYADTPSTFQDGTLGSVGFLSAFEQLGVLFRVQKNQAGREAVIRYPPRAMLTAPTVQPGVIIVDSNMAAPPSGALRTWNRDFRPVGRTMF